MKRIIILSILLVIGMSAAAYDIVRKFTIGDATVTIIQLPPVSVIEVTELPPIEYYLDKE